MCGRPKIIKSKFKTNFRKEYQVMKSYINGLETFETTKQNGLELLSYFMFVD